MFTVSLDSIKMLQRRNPNGNNFIQEIVFA